MYSMNKNLAKTFGPFRIRSVDMWMCYLHDSAAAQIVGDQGLVCLCKP